MRRTLTGRKGAAMLDRRAVRLPRPLVAAVGVLLLLPLLTLVAQLPAGGRGARAPRGQAAGSAGAGAGSTSRPPLQRERPWAIAHRGLSGLMPEHTLAAYQAAIDAGADFVECDVVLTSDLVPVCRHEPNINDTTEAWDVFPDRAATYTIDGEAVTGIFAHDLTLAELRRLRARQRLPFRDQAANGLHATPTLEEYLRLVAAAPRVVGIYPEVKHPSYHNALPALRAANTTIQAVLLAALGRHGYGGRLGSAAWLARPAFLQCFEVGTLRELAQATELPLVLLLGGWPGWVTPDTGQTHAEITSDASLDELASFLAGVGPWKESLYRPAGSHNRGEEEEEEDEGGGGGAPQRGAGGGSSSSGGGGVASRWGVWRQAAAGAGGGAQADERADPEGQAAGAGTLAGGVESTGLAARLLARGLQVHPYTLRDEPRFVGAGFGGDVRAEMRHLFWEEGVQGAFGDFASTLVPWLRRHGPRLDALGRPGGDSNGSGGGSGRRAPAV